MQPLTVTPTSYFMKCLKLLNKFNCAIRVTECLFEFIICLKQSHFINDWLYNLINIDNLQIMELEASV